MRDWLLLGGLLCLSVSLVPPPAVAGIGHDYFCNPEYSFSEPVSVYTLPDGTGDPLTECFLNGGGRADATIQVTLEVDAYLALAGVPAEDLWLAPLHGVDLVTCGGPPLVADGPTDADGRTSFSGAFAAGGSLGPGSNDGLLIIYNGLVCVDSPLLPIAINSPDISGDGVVDISDVVLFSATYSGAYSYRCDFYWDGAINLVDLIQMARGFGSRCQ
jgi:hypothetical protein